MKKIYLLFGLISISAFSYASDDFTPPKNDASIVSVESSVSEVWEVAFSMEFEMENLTVKSSGGVTSVMCIYGDGEYTIGTTSSDAVADQMIAHCQNSGGNALVGFPNFHK